MSETMLLNPSSVSLSPAASFPVLPWRDPHAVSPGDLAVHIAQLEAACLVHPTSANLRTCLGLAYAVNYDVYKSMDALELATVIDPEHFWARLKFGELHFRLRALARAEEETARALELARNHWQLSLARKQLQEIRAMNRASTRNVTWNKPLTVPLAVLSVMMVAVVAGMTWGLPW